jgi:hypothetical protein
MAENNLKKGLDEAVMVAETDYTQGATMTAKLTKSQEALLERLRKEAATLAQSGQGVGCEFVAPRGTKLSSLRALAYAGHITLFSTGITTFHRIVVNG